jgi:hypothetical protein
MKKLILLFVFFISLAFSTTNSIAQEEKDFRFTVKTNPLAALAGPLYVAIIPITGEYKLLFEVKTFQKQSVELSVSYLTSSILLNLDNLSTGDSVKGVRTSGARFQVAYKFFLTKDKPLQGFYVGPHASYAFATIADKNNSDNYFKATKLNLNLITGYQLITKGGFTVNIYTGIGFKNRAYSFSNASAQRIFDFTIKNPNTINVPFGFSFGYAF